MGSYFSVIENSDYLLLRQLKVIQSASYSHVFCAE